jgi:hypothetical protein
MPVMRIRLSMVILAAASLAGVGHAQPGLSTKPDYDLIYKADRIDENRQADAAVTYQRAVAALQAQDFAAAELALAELGRSQARAPADANFLMGLAKIGLEKWDEARAALEVAVKDQPTRPEPKTRLALAYLKLANNAAAKEQRVALASLEAACNKTCKDATWIADGLKLVDQALSSEAVVAKVSAADLAAVAPAAGSAQPFDPARYSLVAFDNTDDLYNLLTQDGRCLPNKTAAPRQPCALILYRPVDGSTEGLTANFKPVFKVVNRKSIWAIHDKKLQKIAIEDLYFDNVDVIGGKKMVYISVALVGNEENTANCQASRPCLGNLVTEDMFNMYRNMPDSVVEVIWGAVGMKDPGTVRIR